MDTRFMLLLVMTSLSLVLADEESELTPLANLNTDFALRMYRKVTEGDTDNIFFAPYSITTALAMTYLGSKGKTKQQMERALGYTDLADEVHEKLRELRDIVFDMTQNYTLREANRIYASKKIHLLKKFTKELQAYYDASADSVNFGDSEGARMKMNKWVKKVTDGRIPDLVGPGLINRNTMMVLVNAIYFKGHWLHRFNPLKNSNDSFDLMNGDTADTQFMHQSQIFSYANSTRLPCSIIEMPYISDEIFSDDISMYILLPHSLHGLKALELMLTLDNLNAALDELRETNVKLSLPKFKITYQQSLKELLSSLGMSSIFTAKADFSGMTGDKSLHVDEVVHQAFVQVNEAGTEAAGATAAIMTKSGSIGGLKFKADRPFLFLIREKTTGTVLFLGRVVNPNTTSMRRRSAITGDEGTTSLATGRVPSFLALIVSGIFALASFPTLWMSS